MAIEFNLEEMQKKHKEELRGLLKEALSDIAQKMQGTSLQTIHFDFSEDRDGIFPGTLFFSTLSKKKFNNMEKDGYSESIQGGLDKETQRRLKFTEKEVSLINEVKDFWDTHSHAITQVINDCDDVIVLRPNFVELQFRKNSETIPVGIKQASKKLKI